MGFAVFFFSGLTNDFGTKNAGFCNKKVVKFEIFSSCVTSLSIIKLGSNFVSSDFR